MTESLITGLSGSTNDTFSATVTILDDYGLHARPAANLARAAQTFSSDIRLIAGGQVADAKSILDILALAASRNTELTLECTGEDAALAGATLLRLFQARFHGGGD